MLRLFALHKVADDGAREEWIFTRILEAASIPWLAGQIYPASQRHIEPLRSEFLANHSAEVASGVLIPTCRSA
jgi:hypothetical protein